MPGAVHWQGDKASVVWAYPDCAHDTVLAVGTAKVARIERDRLVTLDAKHSLTLQPGTVYQIGG